MLELMKILWRRWKSFAHGIIRFQNWFLMSIAYIVGMTPVALVFRIVNPDPTDRGLGDTESDSYWLEPTMGREDIRRAQRPW